MLNVLDTARLFLVSAILAAGPAAAIDVGGCTERVRGVQSAAVADDAASEQEIELACLFLCCNGGGNCNGGGTRA